METIGTSWHSYPKIFALGHREVKDIFKSHVVIQEKIDGSQISFGMIEGELKVKSKSVEQSLDAPDKMFQLAIDRIKAVQHLLRPGYTYRGEYLKTPRHNALEYERVPANNIILFDVNFGHEDYLPPNIVICEAQRLGFEAVPTFMISDQIDPMMVPAMIDNVSCLGGPKMEGVVIKNYSMLGADKKTLMAKYVSEEFKEVHKVKWGESHPGYQDILQLIIESLRTEARWLKTVQHLREQGVLEHSPKDIGKLIVEVEKDVLEECEGYIKDELYKWAKGKISRGVKAGLPEWYKKHLIEVTYASEPSTKSETQDAT